MRLRFVHVAASCVLVVGVACSSGPSAPDDSAYTAEVEMSRQQIERFFRTAPDSPLPLELRDSLLPLPYYQISSDYVVPAALRLSDDRPVFEMPTSTGLLRRMQRVGVLEFTLMGEARSLGAFVEEGSLIISLFVPFADTTTGIETYAAGRYLDIEPSGTGVYNVDFNRAYNPYCAYNDQFDCPFPPASNRLSVAIRAGERTPGA